MVLLFFLRTGFLSIDCGLSGTPNYVGSSNFTYVSDEKFIDTGNNSEISSSYGGNYPKEYLTVRYFPSGARNCYTIRSLTRGSNYLIRATFFYANYDNLNKPPIFDIYLGINFWNTVNASLFSFPEIIISATDDFVDVCLVNKNQGFPFISSLHLRKFETGMYPYVNLTTSLILVWRDNMGGSSLVRSVCKDLLVSWLSSFVPTYIIILSNYLFPLALLIVPTICRSLTRVLTIEL